MITSSLWLPHFPVPEDAEPPPRAHPVRGIPQAQWCYRDAGGQVIGYIYRFTTSNGGKEVLPLSWCRHESTGKTGWRWIAFALPRPLYGLDRLASRPEATVLLVEGEKCADVSTRELPGLVSVTWPGGSKAVDKVDWSPLAGRKVVLWPDCDAHRHRHTDQLLPEHLQPGYSAMRKIGARLLELGCRVWQVRIPEPGEVAHGWDVADAVAEGISGESLWSWVRERLMRWDDTDVRTEVPESSAAVAKDSGGESAESSRWRRGLLYTQKGELAACLANVHDILLNCPACNRKTAEAPPEQDGIEGDCDLCGRWSSTLIEGACHSCRAWSQWQQRGE